MEESSLEVGLEEVGKVMLKIGFGFPCCFFFCMMAPLNLVHSDGFSSGAPFFRVEYSDWMFCISQIWFDFDSLRFDDCGRDLDTLLELGYMENVMISR
jgi:hypothetical protein